MSLNPIALIHLLIAVISLIIALVAFHGYLKVHKRRLLLLSAAFLLLSIPQILAFIDLSFIFPRLREQYGFCEGPYWLVYPIASIAAFALLAYIYNYQRKSQAIRITRAQWAMGGLLLFAEVAYIAYILEKYGRFLSDLYTEDFFEVVYLILGSVAYLLVILIIISLFSYYRAKRCRSTLLVMAGFIFLFMSHVVGVLLTLIHGAIGYGLAPSIELVGYVAFLLALWRPRFLR